MRRLFLYRYGSTAVASLLLGLVMLRLFLPPLDTTDSKPATANQPTLLPTTAKLARPVAPSFDIVRATAQGNMVMAGRATPGATVTVLDGDRPLGSVKADRFGEWVVVPDAALPPGSHSLYVRADTADGFRERSDQPVVLLIPDRPGLPTVSLDTDRYGNVRHGSPVLITAATRLGANGLFLVGRGPADASLIVYYDNLPIGEAIPDERGRWTLAVRLILRNGRHTLRTDYVSGGVVVASGHAFLEMGLPKLVSMDPRRDDVIDFENGIPILVEGGGRRLGGRTPGEGPSVRRY